MESRHDRTASRLLKAGIGATVAAGAFKMMGDREREKQRQLERGRLDSHHVHKAGVELEGGRPHRLEDGKGEHRLLRRHSSGPSDRRAIGATERNEYRERHHENNHRARAADDDFKAKEDRLYQRGRRHDNATNLKKPPMYRGHSEHSHLRALSTAFMHRLAPGDGRASFASVSREPSMGWYERPSRPKLLTKTPNGAEDGEGHHVHFASTARAGGKAYN